MRSNAPDRPRPELFVHRLEVQIMHGAGKVFGSFQLPFHEGLIDDHLGGDIVYSTTNGPSEALKCDEIEKPSPGNDEVLIRVRAASVNPLDYHLLRHPLHASRTVYTE